MYHSESLAKKKRTEQKRKEKSGGIFTGLSHSLQL